MIDRNALPNDVEWLKHLLIEREITLAEMSASLRGKQLQIDHLTVQLAQLRRTQSDGCAESLSGVEQVASQLDLTDAPATSAFRETQKHKGSTNYVEAGCTCPQCRGV